MQPAGAASTLSSAPAGETGAAKGRRTKRRRRRKSSSEPAKPGDSLPEASVAVRERSRRRRSPAGDAKEAEPAREPARSGDSSDRAEETAPRRRGRRRTAASGSGESDPADAGRRADSVQRRETGAVAEKSGGAKRVKRTRRRGSRGGRRRRGGREAAVGIESIPGEIDELPELAELPDEAVLLAETAPAKPARKGSKRAKTPRKAGRGGESGARSRGPRSSRKTAARSRKAVAPRESAEPEAPKKPRIILVNACDPEEVRVCVVEEGKIVDLQMSVRKQVSYVHDIYRGRVVNLETAIGAAFVDFGQGRNGFLHASDVLPSYGEPGWTLEKLLSTPLKSEELDANREAAASEGEPEDEKPAAPAAGRARSAGRGRARRVRLPIDKLVKKGQMVAVQITKDAIGDKGPTLTTYVSIPGRYLVLMPSLERTGVSRKIEDDKERRRLKRILSALDIPEGMGVIVRTAGIGKTKAEIKRDLDYLLLAWDDFARRLKSGRNPAPLYQESDVAIRTMRDLFTSETEAVVVDDPAEFDRMVAFTKKLMPEFVDRVKLHKGPRPLLHTYGVEQDYEKIFSRRVELPSGGSIVFDQTEALVAIDVNSGRTREKGAEFEDIALKTNLEAAPEIARQIKLRDLGGIIVLDYIDMMKAGNRRAVERATREAIRSDRARSKIGRISQFGLLEMTRQRLGPGLSKLVFENCRRCRGSGRQRTASSRAQAILRRLGTALVLKGFTSVEVRAQPEVIEYLKTQLKAELKGLEEKSQRRLVLLSVPDQVEDSVLHYMRADGREVRPGGRRKR